jgi:hypothetical protein
MAKQDKKLEDLDYNGHCIELYQLVKESLKGTDFKICYNFDDEILDFLHLPANPKHYCDGLSRYGNAIGIVLQSVQNPATFSGGQLWYPHALVRFAEDYEDYDHFYISRNATYDFRSVSVDKPVPDAESYVSYEEVKRYVQENLKDDLKVLVDATVKLKEFVESVPVAPIKYSSEDD